MTSDYTGMKIKDVTVLKKLAPLPGQKSSRYLCKCSCGNYCVKTSTQLARAVNFSAGCNCGCKRKADRKAYRDTLIFGNHRKEARR